MFDTLPWQTIIGDDKPFVILLPMQVIRELDKLKDQGNGTVLKRARAISSKLGEILLEEKSSGVSIITCEMPQARDFRPGFSVDILGTVVNHQDKYSKLTPSVL